jgi:hypothetical protein
MRKNMKKTKNVREAYIAPAIELIPVDTETSLLAAVSGDNTEKVGEDNPLDTTGEDLFP